MLWYCVCVCVSNWGLLWLKMLSGWSIIGSLRLGPCALRVVPRPDTEPQLCESEVGGSSVVGSATGDGMGECRGESISM